MKDSFKQPRVALAIDNIRGTFAGEYGGVKYVMFMQRLSELEKLSLTGDEASKDLMMLVMRFSKLIDAVVEPAYRGPEQD